MTRFIPRDQFSADRLAEKLDKTIFKNVDVFVEYYNSGIINRTNEDTKETVREIIETFKDVREKKGKLTFISEHEVLVDEAIAKLHQWSTLVRVRREVEDAIEEGVISPDSTLVTVDGSLLVSTTNEDTNEEELVNIGADKLKSNELEVLESVAFDNSDGVLSISASDILNIKGDFISEVTRILPQ